MAISATSYKNPLDTRHSSLNFGLFPDMLKHPVQTEGRIRLALRRIEKLHYPGDRTRRSCCLERSAESPCPPKKPSRPNTRRFPSATCGGACGTLPGSASVAKSRRSGRAAKVVVRVRLTNIGREGFTAEGLIFQDGKPVRAINANRREVEIAKKAKGGEKFEFFVRSGSQWRHQRSR